MDGNSRRGPGPAPIPEVSIEGGLFWTAKELGVLLLPVTCFFEGKILKADRRVLQRKVKNNPPHLEISFNKSYSTPARSGGTSSHGKQLCLFLLLSCQSRFQCVCSVWESAPFWWGWVGFSRAAQLLKPLVCIAASFSVHGGLLLPRGS